MNKNSVYIKLILVMLFWGGAFVSGRVLSLKIHPINVAFLRFLMASAVMLFFLCKRDKKFPSIKIKELLPLSLLGFSGILAYNYFFFKGLSLVEAGKASVIIAINPVISALFAAIIYKEHLNFKKVIGILIALFGAINVVTSGNPLQVFSIGLSQGEIILFCAVISWMVYTVTGKKVMQNMDALRASTLAVLLGTLLIAPFSIAQSITSEFLTLSFTDWIHVFILGVLCTAFGFVWYYEGVKEIGVAKASSFINLVPAFGISSGFFFLNEQVHLSLIFGVIAIIIGIYLVNKKN